MISYVNVYQRVFSSYIWSINHYDPLLTTINPPYFIWISTRLDPSPSRGFRALFDSAEDGHVGGPASLRHHRDQVLSSLSRGDRPNEGTWGSGNFQMGLAQNYGTNDPQKWSCLVGKPSILGVDNFEPFSNDGQTIMDIWMIDNIDNGW